MKRPEPDNIDEIANGLDDLKTTADELQEESESGEVSAHTVKELKNALERASDAADDLEEDRKD
jgi:hypothetical protein